MKVSAVLFFASMANACPYLGFQVGGENPHEGEPLEAEVEAQYGHLRRQLQKKQPAPPPGPAPPGPEPAPAPAPAPARFEGTVVDGIAAARADIVAMMEAEPSLPAKFLRLGFHDCVGPEGCNGCINLDNPDNAGLLLPMGRLCDMCAFYGSVLTRADCWALAALTAVDESQPDPANKIDFTLFHYGRETCPEGNLLGNWVNEVADFPSPHLTSDDLINYFAGEFTFSPDETVAIMGAHSLRTLSNNRSGFSGAWVHGERIFDNEFYQFLVMNSPDGTTTASTSFVQDNALNANLAYSWVHQSPGGGPAGGRPEIMLNADMALVYDFADYMTMGSDDGMVSCTLNVDGSGAPLCDTTAPTLNKVIEYSQDNVQWTMDFHAAFTKMLLKGHDTSHCIGPFSLPTPKRR